MARWIALLMVLGFSGMMLWVGVKQAWLQRRLLRNAVPVEAVVIRSSVHASDSADSDPRVGRSTSTRTYRPEIRFAYTVDGRAYESDLLRANVIVTTYPSREDAEQVLAPFPVGARVVARVDPTLPDRAFLLAEPGRGPLVFVLVGVLVPLIVGPLVWRFV